MTNVKECPQCKMKNFGSNKVCKGCGFPFDAPPVASPTFANTPPPPPPPKTQAFTFLPKSALSWVGLSLLSLFAFLLITVFLANRSEDLKFTERGMKAEELERKVYSKPEIGMLYTKLTDLCGDADEHRSHESSRADITTITYKYNNERATKNCYGTFTFVNYKLESISR